MLQKTKYLKHTINIGTCTFTFINHVQVILTSEDSENIIKTCL